MNKKLLIVFVLFVLFSTTVSASPDYLNRSVSENIFPQYTFTTLSVVSSLNPQSNGVVSLGQDALRYNTVYANDFNGTSYWNNLAGVPAGLADGDDFLIEADITAMGFTKESDTNETPRVDNIMANVGYWNVAFTWGDHAVLGYVVNETDPVFIVSAASAITGQQIIDWDKAFDWGNHSIEGYLKSADLISAVGNWSDDQANYVNYSSLNYYTDGDIDGTEIAFTGWDKDASDDITTAGGTINGDLFVNGDVGFVGSVFDVTVTNTNVEGDTIPTFDGAFDLGTNALRYKTIYADEFVGSLNWSNIPDRPTDLSAFSNTPGYLYSSQTIFWDKNASDDFDGDYYSLTNIPSDLVNESSIVGLVGNWSADKPLYVPYSNLTYTVDTDTHLTGAEVIVMVGNWSEDKPIYVPYSNLTYTVDTNCETDFCNSVVYDNETIAWDLNAADDFNGEWSNLTNVPADLLDGDDDYCSGGVCDGSMFIPGNLTIVGDYIQATVTNMDIDGDFNPTIPGAFDSGSATNQWNTVYANTLVGTLDWSYLSNVPAGLDDGDDVLSGTDVVTMVGNWSADKPLYVSYTNLNYTVDTDTNCETSFCNSVVYDNETIAWDFNAADDFSGDYLDLVNNPTNLSEFIDDLGYAPSADTNCSVDGTCPDIVYETELTYTVDTDTHANASEINSLGFVKSIDLNYTVDTDTHANFTEIESLGFITIAELPAANLTDTNETPRVNALVASAVNWSQAYAWGDHSTASYLTSYLETDPIWIAEKTSYYTITEVDNLLGNISFNTSSGINITATDVSNWNEAYSWGDHPNVTVNLTDYYNKTMVDTLLVSNEYNDTTVTNRITDLETALTAGSTGVYEQFTQGWNEFRLPGHVIRGTNVAGVEIVPPLNLGGDYSVANVLNSINGQYSYIAYEEEENDWRVNAPSNLPASTFTTFLSGVNVSDFVYHIYINDTNGAVLNIPVV